MNSGGMATLFGWLRGAQYNRILRDCDGLKIKAGAGSGLASRHPGARLSILH
jgi:hypothetical protein